MRDDTSDNKELKTEKDNSKLRIILDFVLESVKIIVICASVIILVRWFLFQPFYVKGESMKPNFHDGEYLIIYQLPYRFPEKFNVFSEEDRGTPIIFHPPNEPGEYYIKRLIGLPGERVKVDEGKVFIYNSSHPNGFALEEDYLDGTVEALNKKYKFDDISLSSDEVYAMGDNRTHSLDSRNIGPIPIKNIVGRPVLRGWPLDKAGIIKKVHY